MIDQDDAVDLINSQFDQLANGKFSTAYLVVQTVRGILERFGVLLPEVHPTGFDEQMVFKANDDLYLCIMIDQDDNGHYDAYAQFVDSDGLNDVLNMDIETDEVEQRQLVSLYLKQVRRSADD